MTREQVARAYARMDERGLSQLAANGDRGAFDVLMQRSNQRLFRVARAVVGNDDEAEDVLQAAYLAAYRSIGGFRGEAGLLTWLTAITLNEARARLRKRRPMLQIGILDKESPVILFPGITPPADPEAEAGRAQVRVLLEAGIDALPEDFRLVFMLREIEGLSVEETAAQLDLAVGTVKTRHFRARRLLREGLERQIDSGLSGVFPFLGKRCERIRAVVLARLT